MKTITNIKDFKAYAKEQEQKAWEDYKQANRWYEDAVKSKDQQRIKNWYQIKVNKTGVWTAWNDVLEALGEA